MTNDKLTASQQTALAEVSQIELGCALVPTPDRRDDFRALVARGLARSYGQGLGGEGFAPTAAGRKEASKNSTPGARERKPRGFALLSPERRREIASMGGKSVAPDDRAFSRDRNLASAAGRVGGETGFGGRRRERSDPQSQ